MLWLLMEVHYSLTSHDTDLPVLPYLVGSSSSGVYIYTHIVVRWGPPQSFFFLSVDRGGGDLPRWTPQNKAMVGVNKVCILWHLR